MKGADNDMMGHGAGNTAHHNGNELDSAQYNFEYNLDRVYPTPSTLFPFAANKTNVDALLSSLPGEVERPFRKIDISTNSKSSSKSSNEDVAKMEFVKNVRELGVGRGWARYSPSIIDDAPCLD